MKLNVCQIDLHNYIKNNSCNKNLIRNLGLERLLSCDLFQYDKKQLIRFKVILAMQKKLNRILKQELLLLFKKAELNDIRIIALKGILLAEDIYDVVETRKSCDIDILAGKSELKSVLMLARELGYVKESGEEINIDMGKVQMIKTNILMQYGQFKTARICENEV